MIEQWQELKETITEMRDNDGTGTQQEVYKFLANYMDILEKQMSGSENPNKWIPVSERLPEIHQDVLVSLRSLDVEVGFRAKTEPCFYCEGGYIELQNVQAWMPLPEPYEPQERSEKE